MRLNDLALGCLVLLGGIAFYISALNFNTIPGQSYGAGTMPRAIAFTAIGLGGFMIVSQLSARVFRPSAHRSDWTRSPRAFAGLFVVLGLIVFYIMAAPILGFVPTAFLVLSIAMLTLGVGIVPTLLVSALSCVVLQQTFGRLLLVPLPRSEFLSFLW